MGIKLNIDDIRRLLDRSTADISPENLSMLRSARQAALQRQRIKQKTPVLVWLDEHGLLPHHHGTSSHHFLNWGLAAFLAVIMIGGVGYWESTTDHDHSALDIAILTDDLPVHMYVD